MYQNVTIGGQTADGKDAVNKLSFLILRSIGQTRLPQPNLTVRYHRNINQAFMDEVSKKRMLTATPRSAVWRPQCPENGATAAQA